MKATDSTVLFFLYLGVFLFGSRIGSFLNVMIDRIPHGISIAIGRSSCPICHSTISWYDHVPLLGWILRKGRCRNCKNPISIRYPITEMISGTLAVWITLHFGFTLQAGNSFLMTAILIVIAVIDRDTMTIPNSLVLALLIPVGISLFLHPEVWLFSRLLGFFLISFPMLLLTLLIPDCFGGGDIKLTAVCGLYLGAAGITLAVFIAILLGGFYAIYLLAVKKVERGSHFAFGPYLAVGIWVAMMYQNPIITCYLESFQLLEKMI